MMASRHPTRLDVRTTAQILHTLVYYAKRILHHSRFSSPHDAARARKPHSNVLTTTLIFALALPFLRDRWNIFTEKSRNTAPNGFYVAEFVLAANCTLVRIPAFV
jgi:hypothetical protein